MNNALLCYTKPITVSGDLVVVSRYCSTIGRLKAQSECSKHDNCKKWNEGKYNGQLLICNLIF